MTEADNLENKRIIHNTPPAERLQKVYGLMRIKPSVAKLPSYISSILDNKPADISKFTHKIGGHNWTGYIYHSRNSLYGSIFSYFGKTPIVIRGMPKISYSEDARVLNNESTIEEKIDGTNLVLWTFPDGTFWGKTRETETIFGGGYRGQDWFALLEETGYVPQLILICRAGYGIIVELYGYKNKGEFVNYTVPIAIKVLEIYDRKTFKFLHPHEKQATCYQFGLPCVKAHESITLTPKELERLEYEAKAFVKEDGLEGFVAKYFDPETQDVHMGKIKCSEIRELCWGDKIPMNFIWKAIRKCEETNVSLTIDGKENPDAITFIKNEMMEDFTEVMINKNMSKVYYGLLHPHEPKMDITLFENEEVNKMLDELTAQGMEISIGNKNKVMSIVGTRLTGGKSTNLYKAFLAYIEKRDAYNNSINSQV
jgi:hypothetical protein